MCVVDAEGQAEGRGFSESKWIRVECDSVTNARELQSDIQ